MSTKEPESEKGEPKGRVLAAEGVEKPKPKKQKKKRDWKIILIGVLVFLALVGSLVAWLQGKASRQPQVNELTTERDECLDEKMSCEATRTELEGRIQELEARRQVSRAVEELVARNFGSAQDALEQASEGLRARRHTELADRVAAVELVPTDDVGEQRDALLALARDVDRAIGE